MLKELIHFLRPTVPPAPVVPPAPLPVTAASRPAPLLQTLIRPEVRGRWMLPALESVTPAYIEQILDAAIAGEHSAQHELFELMEDTWPRLSKNLNRIKRAVRSMDWRVEPWAEDDQPATPDAVERANLVSDALWRMTPNADEPQNDFGGTVYDLMDAWGKGVSVLEVGWEVRGGLILPQSTWWVHPTFYGWSRDGWLGLRLNQKSGELTRFEADKFLIGRCQSRTTHPIGAALLRPLAFWWCAANFSASWLLNLAQIFGLPIRWANYDPSASEDTIGKICDMLENIGSAGWAALPAGTSMELKEPTKTGDTYPSATLMDRADKQCDLLILGQTLTSDAQATGTQALGTVHEGVEQEILRAAADWVAGVLNAQLVPAVLRLNFGDTDQAPEICAEPNRTEDAKANAERDAILINAGMRIPEAWFHERHGVPMPQDDEPVVKKAEPVSPFGLPQTPNANPTADNADGEDNADAEDETPRPSTIDPRQPTNAVHAADAATDQLINRVLEDMSGVQARWLSGVKPFFADLMQRVDSMTDEEFAREGDRVIARASKFFPELFHGMNHQAVADALERAMGAAVVNGAVRGSIKRRTIQPESKP